MRKILLLMLFCAVPLRLRRAGGGRGPAPTPAETPVVAETAGANTPCQRRSRRSRCSLMPGPLPD